MSVTNTGSIVAHVGNGVTTQFPFSFPVSPANKVLLNVYIQNKTSFLTVKTLSQSEFSVAFAPAGNGVVTYNPSVGPLGSAYRLVIERQVPYLQELELTRYGGYDGVAIMRAMDRQEMQIQQLFDKLARAVTVPYGASSNDLSALLNSAAASATSAAASAAEAAGWAAQAAQYMADAEELIEIIDAVVPDVMNFSGNGILTTFELSNPNIAENAVNVYIFGVYQQKNTFSIVDGTLTFTTPPPTGTNNIEVVMAGGQAVLEPPAGTTWVKIVGALPTENNYEGRIVYLTTDDKLYTYDGTDWHSVGSGTTGDPEDPDPGDGIPDFGYIEPVSTLPDTDNFPGRTVYNLVDGKTYIYVGGDWTALNLGGDGTGGGGPVDPGDLPDDASFVYIYPILPEEGLFEGQLAYQELDGKLYTWNGTAWVPVVSGSDVNFPDGFTGVEIVTLLPSTDNFEGRIVYLQTDGKLYRYTASGWSRETAAADLAGQITSTQISDGAISTPKLAAGSIVASKIAANAITSDAILAGAILSAKIASGAIISDNIAAGAISADKIQAGAVTAAKINVTSLAAISATLGAVNISNAIIGSLQVDTLNIAGNAVTVQAGAETAGGISIGASFQQMQTVTVSWGTSASIWVFCQFKASVADELQIDVRSGGSSLLGSPKQFSPKADAFSHYIDMFPTGAVSGAGLSFWLKRSAAGSTTINARKMAVLAAKR